MRDYGKSWAPWGPSYCVHRDVLVNVEEDDANNTHVKNNDFRLHLVDTPANGIGLHYVSLGIKKGRF